MKEFFTVLCVIFAILLVGQSHALSQVQDEESFYYVGDIKECELIDYSCSHPWKPFSDDNGCGCKAPQDADIICTMEYAPVCGVPYFECPEGALCAMPLPVTYSTKCHLEVAGATFLYEGVCEHEQPKACPENWDPVCGKTSAKACMGPGCASEFKTYSNMCFLETDNAELQYEGKCKEKTVLPEPIKTKYYVGDTQMCQRMKYACEDGWNAFSDSIGCGCEKEEDTISKTVKEKIHQIVKKFVQRLEQKGYSHEKIAETIDLVILKIEILKIEKAKYKDILEYTIEVLKDYRIKYEEGDLDIIKDIFQDF